MRITPFLVALALASPAMGAPPADEAAIRTLYARYQAAYKTHALEPVMAMTASTYTATMKDGKKLSRSEYRQVMEQQLHTTGTETLTIASLEVHGKTATAVTEETLTAPAMGGHVMASVAKGRDSWIRTAAGWRLLHTESLSEAYTMDGQPFDPSAFKPGVSK